MIDSAVYLLCTKVLLALHQAAGLYGHNSSDEPSVQKNDAGKHLFFDN